jgi:hypothetical protein
MSIVSHLYQLFHPETCQAYIHRLRWKDRLCSAFIVSLRRARDLSPSSIGLYEQHSPGHQRSKSRQ